MRFNTAERAFRSRSLWSAILSPIILPDCKHSHISSYSVGIISRSDEVFIKEITREAGITEKIEVSYVENGERKTHLVEKCDLVKTHTARRSGATNMYLAGIPTIAIMKITGHKTEKEFMKYIKITEEQTAMELMNHPYFSGR